MRKTLSPRRFFRTESESGRRAYAGRHDGEVDWENGFDKNETFIQRKIGNLLWRKGNYDEAQGLTDNEVNYIDEKSVPAPCSRTALVRDRYIDEIKAEKKGKTWKKVDDKKWDKIVQRMKDKEKAQQKLKYDKDNRMV